MKKEFREIVKMLAVGFAAMVALPLAYRIWLHYHPQPETPRPSLSAFLAKSAEERAMRLLQTPLSKWTAADVKSEPKIHAWLEAHETMVLPWEWSDEARRKDPSGCRKLWLALVKEQERELNRLIDDVQGRLKAIDRKLSAEGTVYAHRTNQIARVGMLASTNSFPMTVAVERLSKGRLWGWNRKVEEVRFEKREDFDGEGGGWLSSERQVAATEERRLRDYSAASKGLAERLGLVRELLARTAALEGREDLNAGVCLPEICHFIAAVGAVGD